MTVAEYFFSLILVTAKPGGGGGHLSLVVSSVDAFWEI